ncbi:MAG: curli production assembly protein CsgG [Gammaproteobacteria bacterium]|nr:curli production assembly protein CsgG [Gammaproteobacteria bacterium]
MIKHALLFLLIPSLYACSTATIETVNKPDSDPQMSTTIVPEYFKGLKRKIAIARFTNETRHSNSFLLNQNNDKIGKQAMDILSARLTQTGKFLMFERADLGKIKTEQNIAQVNLEVVGADYLIIGSVSEFGRKATSEVGVFSRNLKQLANATVNVRLVDVTTGQIVFSQEGSGSSMAEANQVFGVGEHAGYDASIDDKALSAAISKLVSNLVENLMDKPWVAYILDQQQGQVIISGGKAQGLRAGDELKVLIKGRKVKNQQTGMMIELPRTEAAKLTVMAFSGEGDNEVSICTVTGGSLNGLAIKDLVVQEI